MLDPDPDQLYRQINTNMIITNSLRLFVTALNLMVDLCLCWRIIPPSSFKKERTQSVICRYSRVISVNKGNCLKHDFD